MFTSSRKRQAKAAAAAAAAAAAPTGPTCPSTPINTSTFPSNALRASSSSTALRSPPSSTTAFSPRGVVFPTSASSTSTTAAAVMLPAVLTDGQALPRLIVFDLDYTLWPFWVDTDVVGTLRRATTTTVPMTPISTISTSSGGDGCISSSNIGGSGAGGHSSLSAEQQQQQIARALGSCTCPKLPSGGSSCTFATCPSSLLRQQQQATVSASSVTTTAARSAAAALRGLLGGSGGGVGGVGVHNNGTGNSSSGGGSGGGGGSDSAVTVLTDRIGNRFELFRDVPAILWVLAQQQQRQNGNGGSGGNSSSGGVGGGGLRMALASRSQTPDVAREMLKLFVLDVPDFRSALDSGSLVGQSELSTLPPMPWKKEKPRKLIEFFDQMEIYPSSKIRHFEAIHRRTGVAYADMLFFDDEKRNEEVSRLGVTFWLVTNGLDWQQLEQGIIKWRDSRTVK